MKNAQPCLAARQAASTDFETREHRLVGAVGESSAFVRLLPDSRDPPGHTRLVLSPVAASLTSWHADRIYCRDKPRGFARETQAWC
jgi:hypothetical protein